jgi:hydroxyacyl-ACP dehydratase HTD2-like protein with hotdog domain
MKTERAVDIVAPTSVAALAATLDHDAAPHEGDALPPLWHWIFFRPIAKQSLIAEDGHPKKGGFLPDLGLPRRMWAGGRLRFPAPVIVGERITRESTILNVSEKQGRTGKLGFVTVSIAFTAAMPPRSRKSTTSCIASRQRPVRPRPLRSPRLAMRNGNATSFLTRHCCCAIRRSPSTRIAFTTTSLM